MLEIWLELEKKSVSIIVYIHTYHKTYTLPMAWAAVP